MTAAPRRPEDLIVLMWRGKVCHDEERLLGGALYIQGHPQSGCNR